MERAQLVENITCMTRLLSAVKDCFIQDRAVKDEIITLGSEILLENVREMKKISRELDAIPKIA